MVRADFNGDGYLDLATLGDDGYRATVMLGFGDGTFATPQSYTLTSSEVQSSQGMVTADFDADGHPDLAVVGSNGIVQILAGSASGAMTVRSPIDLTISSPVGLVTGDFNDDGKPDLAVFGSASGEIAVLTNTGGFAFTESDQSLLSGNPSALAAADVNDDGRVDLVAGFKGSQEVTVILSKTAGFSPSPPVALASPPGALQVGDVDGNGTADVVVGCTDGSVQVLLGNGQGGLGTPSALDGTVSSAIDAVGLGDVDGDGHMDVVALAGSSFSVWSSTSAGKWVSPLSFMPGGLGGMVVGDLNGDGLADVAVGLSTNSVDQVAVLLAAPDTLLAAPTHTPNAEGFGRAVLVDVNGDGHLDAVAVSTNGNEAGVFLNTGDGTFASVTMYGVGTGAQPADIAAGDFNGDGKVDLAVASPGLGAISVLMQTATGFAPVRQVTAAHASGVLAGDFNNDGKLDLLGYSESGFEVLPGLGNGDFGSAIQTGSAGLVRLVATKLNKDQTLDLAGITLTYSDYTYYAGVVSLLGNGDGTFGGGVSLTLDWNDYSIAGLDLAVGDFNDDGNNDVMAYHKDVENSQGSFQFCAGDGTGTLADPSTDVNDTISQATGVAIAAGDFDGDGKLDVAVASDHLGVYLGDGKGGLAAGFGRAVTQTLTSLAAGDLAGDGRPSLFYGTSAGSGELLNLCK